MELLRIESTKFTPGIVFDPNRNVLEIFGFSLPENAFDFYQPILDWLIGYKTELQDKKNFSELSIIFKLVYYNSSSLRQILNIFQILAELHQMEVPINISWQYDSEDPAMAENGKELADIAKVPVNIVAYN
jgi:hypothetical protein